MNVSLLSIYMKQKEYIENDFRQAINRTNLELSEAHQSIVSIQENTREHQKISLVIFRHELENASLSVQSYIEYYNLQSKTRNSLMKVKLLFDSYIHTASTWENAIQFNESENIPTANVISDFSFDFGNLLSKFSVYEGAKGNSEIDFVDSSYDDLSGLMDDVYKEMKSNEIRTYLDKRNFGNIK